MNLKNRMRPVGKRVLVTLASAAAFAAACSRVDSTHSAGTDTSVSTSTIADTTPDVIISTVTIPKTCPLDTGARLVSARGIGPAQLGMPIGDLKKLCTVRDSSLREDEGQPAKAYVISIGNGPGSILIFTGEATKIRQASSLDSIFRTSAGIGVGSTVGDVRRGHGKVCGGLGPTGIEVWPASLPGVVLGTTAYPPKMPGGGTGLTRDASTVPDSAHITTIAVSTTARGCQ